MKWTPDVCIYHHPCADGFGAAYSVWKRFGNLVNFQPRQYGSFPPNCRDKNVLIVDFSFPKDVIESLAEKARQVVILDHHKTAMEDLSGFPKIGIDEDPSDRGEKILVHFDMNRSGASLAWRFCHKTNWTPSIISYIEDRDLWLHSLPDTKEINIAIASYDMDFELWDRLAEGNLDEIVHEGKAILRHSTKVCKAIASSATVGGWEGFDGVPVVNCPSIYSSDVGNYLLSVYPKAPFSVCYNVNGPMTVFSLRSDDSRLDVSEICKRFGGGGHRNAAGFKIVKEA